MELYVSKNGFAGADGGKNNPYSSISEAQAAVRAIIAKGLTEPVTVHVGAGRYERERLVFTAEDSGTETYPITYVADGEVVLSGGIRLSPSRFVPVSEDVRECLTGEARWKVVQLDLGALGISRSDYGEICTIGSHNTAANYDGAVTAPLSCELFVNGERMILARYPNEGFLYNEGAIREGNGWESFTHGCILQEEFAKSRNPISDIYRIDSDTAYRAAAWQYGKDAWMFGYPAHDWADMSTPIVSVDAETCAMETKYVSMFGVRPVEMRDKNYFDSGRYYLYNVLDELDMPGEWYLNRDCGILYLYPEVPIEECEIVLSLSTEPVIVLDGASHLRFCGFTLSYSRNHGVGGTCSDVTLERCLIENVGLHGVSLSGYRNTVRDCEIRRTGHGGIFLDGGDRPTLTHGNNLAENNYIHHFPKLCEMYQSGIHLLGCGNVARHNEICYTPHQAVGYYGNEHLIEYNHLHHCTYKSSDAGAIYAGYDWAGYGTVIRYNRIEHVGSEEFRSSGIYWDDGLSGQTAYGNIFSDVGRYALHINGGRDNRFEHNLILRCDHAAMKLSCSFRISWLTKKMFYPSIEPATGRKWKVLAEMPYQSPLWAERYPSLAKIKTDPDTDINDPDFAVNASYCVLRGNAVVASATPIYRFDEDATLFSEVKNNVYYATLAEAGIDEESYRVAAESPIFTDVPDFGIIPTERIGRRK